MVPIVIPVVVPAVAVSIAVCIGFPFQDFTAHGVNIKIVFRGVQPELPFIDHPAVFQIHLHGGNFPAAGLFYGNLLRPLHTDIGAFICRTGIVGVIPQVSRLSQQGQVIDGQLCQHIRRKGGVRLGQKLHPIGLALGNPILGCQSLQLAAAGKGLTEHTPRKGHLLQALVDTLGQFLLDGLAPGGVRIVHCQQYGVGIIGEVTVLHHSADNRVNSGFQVSAFQLHAFQQGLGVLVERVGGEHLLLPVHFQLDAGVYVNAHRSVHRKLALILVSAEKARCQHQSGSHANGPIPDGMLFLLLILHVLHGLCHR